MTKFYPAAVTPPHPVRTKSSSGRWCRHNRRCKPPPLTPGIPGQAGVVSSEMHVIIAMMRNFAAKRRGRPPAVGWKNAKH